MARGSVARYLSRCSWGGVSGRGGGSGGDTGDGGIESCGAIAGIEGSGVGATEVPEEGVCQYCKRSDTITHALTILHRLRRRNCGRYYIQISG